MRTVQLDLTVREVQIIRAVLLQTIQSKKKLQIEINTLENRLQDKVEGK